MQYEELSTIPDLMAEYRAVMRGKVPVVGTQHRALGVPSSGYRVRDVQVPATQLATYTRATNLRLGSELPITYPFVLSFPLVMKLMSREDFPFSAVGAVHISNVVEQTRPLTVEDSMELAVHAENLRPHRKGLLIDFVTAVTVEGAEVCKQTSTFLSIGAKFDREAEVSVRSRGEETGTVLEKRDVTHRAPNATVKVSPDQILEYADASGDRNPLHVSKLGAKAFGFPSVIAHGMWTAAAMLGTLEGRIPGAAKYTVEFRKPVVLPATVGIWADELEPNRWSLQAGKASAPEKVHAVGEI